MGHAREHTQDLLIFHSSGFDCAFPLEEVREIVPMAELSSPPGMPSGLAGFLNLRGTAIPIVRMDRLFNLPEQRAGLHTPMIVLRGALGPIGILVDSVRGIVRVTSRQMLDIPGDRTFQGCARAVIELDDGVIHVLSPPALVDFSAMSQARLLQLLPVPTGEETN
jgi:purine-binding chemotaxis protein CheW